MKILNRNEIYLQIQCFLFGSLERWTNADYNRKLIQFIQRARKRIRLQRKVMGVENCIIWLNILTWSCNVFIAFTYGACNMIVCFLISSYALMLFKLFILVSIRLSILMIFHISKKNLRFFKSVSLHKNALFFERLLR